MDNTLVSCELTVRQITRGLRTDTNHPASAPVLRLHVGGHMLVRAIISAAR